MQISRLFEIVYILINKRSITAKELSEHFEISQRTVYRDIETLASAGIPIYTDRGRSGGIRLLENFTMSKTVFSEQEQNEILTALQSFKVIKNKGSENLLNKLSAVFNRDIINWIEVDFSDWSYSGHENFSTIKNCILDKKCLVLDYFSSQGEKTHRIVQPIKLWFKYKSWYVKAFCLLRKEMRFFKLSRIKNLRVTDDSFEIMNFLENNAAEPDEVTEIIEEKPLVKVKLKIDSSTAYRVYDEFDHDSIHMEENGDFIITTFYPDDDWVYGYFLSYNLNLEVLEPYYMRDNLKEKVEKILHKYNKG